MPWQSEYENNIGLQLPQKYLVDDFYDSETSEKEFLIRIFNGCLWEKLESCSELILFFISLIFCCRCNLHHTRTSGHNNDILKQMFSEKELRTLSSNFHFCSVSVSDLYTRSTIGLAYSAAGKYVDRFWECINRSQTQECGDWDRGRAIAFWEYINVIFVAVWPPPPSGDTCSPIA